MTFQLLLDNILQPAVLFFALGIAAALARSDLELPQPAPKLLSLYLLMAIGFRGGVELATGGVDSRGALLLAAAVAMSALTPLYTFFLLKRRFGAADAAALAATYGSISAVTFITAVSFLEREGAPFGGHLVAAMALMESPAIVVAVLLFRNRGDSGGASWRSLARESMFNGAVVILLGSLLIGLLSGGRGGGEALEPFTDHIFRGVLSLFLLDLGLVAARRLGDIRRNGVLLVAFGTLLPLFNAAAAIAIARLIGVGSGDALLFTILCASASYIAVPAAVRLTIPEANPSIYVTSALAITFPFNIVVGIPLYYAVISRIWSAV
jgi:uncharacterized protein